MAFADQMTLARDETFRDRVTIAVLTAAKDITAESVTPASIGYHQQRQGLAFAMIQQPNAAADRFAYLVATNVAITAASSDNDIQFTVNSLWDAVAGIAAFQTPSS